MRAHISRLLATLVVAILVLAAALAAQAGSSLSGTVTVDGRPKAGVTVAAYPPGETKAVATGTTGPDGKFRLPVPRGVYRVEFAAQGFETARRIGVVVLPDADQNLDVILLPANRATISDAVDNLRDGEVAVRIETIYGIILLAIDTKHAPVTSANFLKYVDAGLYKDGRFHRATRPDNYQAAPPNRPMMELIQGGINPDRRNDGFPAIPLERTTVTGLKHVAGTVSMARGAADTATSDFFILLDDQPSLDAGGKRFDDEQGAAAFGRVIYGMSVVRRIQQQPVQGQNLTPPVRILAISRQ